MVTGLLRWERRFGAQRALRAQRGRVQPAPAGSGADFSSPAAAGSQAGGGGAWGLPPGTGARGRQRDHGRPGRRSPRGRHGSRWSVFILFRCSVLFLTQRPPRGGAEREREDAAGGLLPPAAARDEGRRGPCGESAVPPPASSSPGLEEPTWDCLKGKPKVGFASLTLSGGGGARRLSSPPVPPFVQSCPQPPPL